MVPWYEVEDYMHLEGVGDSELSSRISDGEKYGSGNGETGADSGFSYVSGSAGQGKDRNSNNQTDSGYRPPRNAGIGSYEDEEELKAIFERTFGPVKRYKEPQFKRTFSAKSDSGS